MAETPTLLSLTMRGRGLPCPKRYPFHNIAILKILDWGIFTKHNENDIVFSVGVIFSYLALKYHLDNHHRKWVHFMLHKYDSLYHVYLLLCVISKSTHMDALLTTNTIRLKDLDLWCLCPLVTFMSYCCLIAETVDGNW